MLGEGEPQRPQPVRGTVYDENSNSRPDLIGQSPNPFDPLIGSSLSNIDLIDIDELVNNSPSLILSTLEPSSLDITLSPRIFTSLNSLLNYSSYIEIPTSLYYILNKL